MRHPHGLRAATGDQGIVVPAIGDAFRGGFYAGSISHTANGVATHALIVAPRATGASGSLYTLTTAYTWKTASTTTTGTTSSFNGAANTAAMVTAGIAAHPAANFCKGLSIGGYTDWYLPAIYELDIAYQNLKPTTANNSTSWGINPYSVPERTTTRSTGTPGRTSITIFQSGGAEAFVDGAHWASAENNSTTAWLLSFVNGFQGTSDKLSTGNRVRAFRKEAL